MLPLGRMVGGLVLAGLATVVTETKRCHAT
jgi:hypothetical protein